MTPYDHKAIEKKWQTTWKAKQLYHTKSDSLKPKAYVLDMFPYPSGDGLHLGHVENYTATCIYSRYLRMKGFNVLHPIGWDAFGLPAENYAIKTNVHPDESTHNNIKNFTAQIKSLGISYDWSREIDTSSPEYYRWTQWFFLLLHKNGLAYKKKAKVNWCDSCKTVLANEQAENGICERCKNTVLQKDLEQWFFKITDFVEDLINDLDTLDWPSSTKAAQKNWIGKSEGVEFTMDVSGQGGLIGEKVAVYTTRADTIFGMTYVVLAPEHPLVARVLTVLANRNDVEAYMAASTRKTELERTGLVKEKTGVRLQGVVALHPFTKEEIPIFVGDYVLGSYGSGAVMGVPAHDERDFEFAEKFNIPTRKVVLQSALAQVPLNAKDVALGVAGKLRVVANCFTDDGELVNSGAFNGLTSAQAREAIAKDLLKKGVGDVRVNYRLRDWLVSRQRYWGAPIPIIYCTKCGEVPVPEDQLPVLLPTDVDFRPTGESPLVNSKSFHEVSCPKCGIAARRESDTMDTFVCSSWYYFRFTDPANKTEFASRDAIKKWLPVDMYMGGAEHTVLHLLYARFFTKVLKKFGYVELSEPFQKLRHQGMILGTDGRKMSKSLGNVANPNEYIESVGADTLRMAEMFLGPLEDMKPWNIESVVGPRRFIERVWRLADNVKEGEGDAKIEAVLHKTIKKVSDDIETFGFNTAISALMILVNAMEKAPQISRSHYETLLMLLAPFAPHVTEELWSLVGNSASIHLTTWPVCDEAKMVAQEDSMAIQVNGKARDVIVVPADITEKALREVVLLRPQVEKWIEGKEIKKIIVVPHRVINIVTGG